ncbi:zinc dependent phospholipase C family protein [Eubacteriaceae bacterium ES2]|nr:zinc dependent phospholipase C family protein [Eubacteriaceae bacterium ES2]
MMFTTHIHIGQFLHEQLTKQVIDSFQVNRRAFIYGNIKPDITRMVFYKHQITAVFDLFCKQVDIAKDVTRSDWHRSIALGVVSHFLCDFFCKFHAKNPYKESSKWTHFWYEWDLHHIVLQDLIVRTSSETQYISDPLIHQSSFSNNNGYFDGLSKEKSNYQYLVDLINHYCSKKENTTVDKDFAFYAINETFEKILGIELFMIKENNVQNYNDHFESPEDTAFLNGKAVF